jgi:exopolysaccharide biosynthesis WecB/TagA/CpsF family protein
MFHKVIGIPFVDEPASELVDYALQRGGLVTVPSGPGLAVDLRNNPEYRRALVESNLNIPDSGAMCLFWRLFKGERIRRVSGLEFLTELFERTEVKEPAFAFWVHPTASQQWVNKIWLRGQGFAINDDDSYIAPMYAKSGICDESLLKKLMRQRPKVIILCIGGGVQERLGYWVREQYKQAELPCPAIICTGAAMGFLSGNQVNIPVWADRLYLGWFFRCLYQPTKFIPRYWNALPLAYLIARYGEKLPPLKV